ncbi:lactate utilization protein [Desulfovibrio sp. OttesenSCG-928-G15]|nr:lactate utilization protein [Desulfovibrio sp. OttesenSCG-928-G15]
MKDENAEATSIQRTGAPRERSPFTVGREKGWEVILQHTGANMLKRGFGVSLASGLADAAAIVVNDLLPASGAKVVAFGGSMTVREAGLLESIKAVPGLEVMDTFDMSIGLEAMIELRRKALLSDLFICSANALSRDGQMILVDGIGNRTAAVQFGPKKVILLVGRNKICTNLEEGANRIKYLAAPANSQRLNKKTPCVKTGQCMDCNSPDRICTYWTTVQRSNPAGRIHVILIDEETGF